MLREILAETIREKCMTCLKKAAIWLLTGVLVFVMLSVGMVKSYAATIEQINDGEVFLKQSSSGYCTLTSATMMLRRYAYLRDDEDWENITESSTADVAWLYGTGLYHNFQYPASGGTIEVSSSSLPGNSDNIPILIDLLNAHPEGIVLYDSSAPHAVLLTDYTDGVFYCADPAGGYPSGRIPLSECYAVRADTASYYWYVSSPEMKLDCSHNWQFTVIVEPGCETTGLGHEVCSLCGEVQENVVLEPTGHEWVTTEIHPASYDSDGDMTYVCSACGQSKTIVLPMLTGISITQQPIGQTAEIGQDVQFTVQATGQNLSYQWYFSKDHGKTWKKFEVANGSRNSTLQLVVSRQSDGLLVRCQITNDHGVTRLTNAAAIKVS